MVLEQQENPEMHEITEKEREKIIISSGKLKKTIIKVGESLTKPTEIDHVMVKVKAFFTNYNENSEDKDKYTTYKIKELTFETIKEFSLEEDSLPKSIKRSLESMRKQESSLVEVPFDYIHKFCHKNKIELTGKKLKDLVFDNEEKDSKRQEDIRDDLVNKMIDLYSQDKLVLDEVEYNISSILKQQHEELVSNNTKTTSTENDNNKNIGDIKDNKDKLHQDSLPLSSFFSFIITLNDFYTIQAIDHNGLVKKKIIKNGTKWYYPKDSDRISFSFKVYSDEIELYSKSLNNVFYDEAVTNKQINFLEKRLLQNLKHEEKAEIYIPPDFFVQDKTFTSFLSEYPQAKDKIITFYSEMHCIERFDYLYKDTDRYGKNNKKKVIQEGIGRDFPDRESYVKLKLLVKVNGKILYNGFNFNVNDDEDLTKITNKTDSDGYLKFREKINLENDINDDNIDMEDDYNTNLSIYNRLTEEELIKESNSSDINNNTHKSNDNLLDYDMKAYLLPISIRKAIVHMKRNEILYLNTNFIDYLEVKDLILQDVSSKNKEYNNSNNNNNNTNKEPKIEIVIHLFEFLHRKIFSNLSYPEKLSYLMKTKEEATKAFKNNSFFKASKLFNNVYFRFIYGDVFGNLMKIQNDDLKNKDKAVYEELMTVLVSCFLNLANCKLKLGNSQKAIEVIDKLLTEAKDFLSTDKEVKALFMKAKAYMNYSDIENLELAILNFNMILAKELSDNVRDEAKQNIDICNKRINDINNQKKSLFKKMFHEKQ